MLATIRALRIPAWSLVIAISFRRVSVVAVCAAAVNDVAVTVTAKPAGAAVTACVARAEASEVAPNVTPRRLRTPRNFSRARLTRF